mmetsp:Transcript_140361/g.448607  ORF Transcript_140361/g.448607 Transcript_140361/m.448607 type:complete len:386 (-) Transcript_140361:961-2118(-)
MGHGVKFDAIPDCLVHGGLAMLVVKLFLGMADHLNQKRVDVVVEASLETHLSWIELDSFESSLMRRLKRVVDIRSSLREDRGVGPTRGERVLREEEATCVLEERVAVRLQQRANSGVLERDHQVDRRLVVVVARRGVLLDAHARGGRPIRLPEWPTRDEAPPCELEGAGAEILNGTGTVRQVELKRLLVFELHRQLRGAELPIPVGREDRSCLSVARARPSAVNSTAATSIPTASSPTTTGTAALRVSSGEVEHGLGGTCVSARRQRRRHLDPPLRPTKFAGLGLPQGVLLLPALCARHGIEVVSPFAVGARALELHDPRLSSSLGCSGTSLATRGHFVDLLPVLFSHDVARQYRAKRGIAAMFLGQEETNFAFVKWALPSVAEV